MKKETYPFSSFLFFFFSTDACCCLIQTLNLPAHLTAWTQQPHLQLISFIHFVVLYIFIFPIWENFCDIYIINILFCWVVFVITIIIIIITIVTSLLWSVIMYVIIICNLMEGVFSFLYIHIFATHKYGIQNQKQSYFIYSIYIFGSIWVNFCIKWKMKENSILNLKMFT